MQIRKSVAWQYNFMLNLSTEEPEVLGNQTYYMKFSMRKVKLHFLPKGNTVFQLDCSFILSHKSCKSKCMQKSISKVGDVANWYNSCLACTRPWNWFPILEEKKKPLKQTKNIIKTIATTTTDKKNQPPKIVFQNLQRQKQLDDWYIAIFQFFPLRCWELNLGLSPVLDCWPRLCFFRCMLK